MLPELLGFLGRAVAVFDVQPHHPQLLAGVGRAGVVALACRVSPDLGGVAAPVGEDQLAEAEGAGGRVGGGGGEAQSTWLPRLPHSAIPHGLTRTPAPMNRVSYRIQGTS